MLSPSLVLLSDQSVLQRSMDVVANNIANSSTTGFKRQGIEFDTYLSQPAPGKTLNFVVDRATYRDAATGPIQNTGNPLDIAIQGSGYFEVQKADGTTHYTRGGSFQLNTQGQITTLAGDIVLGDGGQGITVPDTVSQLNIGNDGSVSARVDNGANLAELGKITVVNFDNEQQMQAEGAGLYSTTQTPKTALVTNIAQGALESSNVEPVTEMTQMIKIQRAYEQTANLLSQENNRLDNAINTLSKTTVG